MANVITGKVWILDSTGLVKAHGVPIHIRKILWTGAANTNAVELRDGLENIIYAHTASTYQLEFFDDVDTTFDGLEVQTIGGGKLYLYM